MKESKLRILVVASWYPSRAQPHLGTFVERQASAAALYNSVSVLHVCSDPTLTTPVELDSSESEGVFTVRVYYKKSANPLTRFLRIRSAYRLGWEAVKARTGIPDVMQLNILWPAGLFIGQILRDKKIPYLITENWTGYLPSDNSFARSGFFRQFVSRAVARQAAMITPVSEDLGKSMKNLGLGSRFETVFNVVNTNLFFPPAQRTTSPKTRFLHVSTTLDAQKNITGILEAVRDLSRNRSDFELRIVSEKDFSAHERKADQLGILNKYVWFESAKQEAGVAEAMRKADCFVLFSNYENLPVVILEAMATGLPVIASTAGGTPEHLRPEFGKLVAPRDTEGLKSAMNDMIGKTGNYDSAAIRQYAVQHFSREAVGNRFNDIYHMTLSRYV